MISLREKFCKINVVTIVSHITESVDFPIFSAKLL